MSAPTNDTAPPPPPHPASDPSPPAAAATVLYVLGAAFAVSPWASPPIALALGMALGVLGLTAWRAQSKTLSRVLIQACVVLLGLRLNFGVVLRTAVDGLAFAAGTIGATFALGFGLARVLRLERQTTVLISSGTAICGGSAIAAVGSAIRASAASMAVATATVFLLNAVALWVFPIIGDALHLTPTQFGTWAGVAIHDVSSVVGAASYFDKSHAPGAGASLDTANVVKLSRVLWILPVTVFAAWTDRRARTAAEPAGAGPAPPIPWFIGLFVLASLARTFIPALAEHESHIKSAAGVGFRLALFLIGAGLTRHALAAVGWRALALGVALWVFISAASLAVVLNTR